eukprot:gene9282-1556_t
MRLKGQNWLLVKDLGLTKCVDSGKVQTGIQLVAAMEEEFEVVNSDLIDFTNNVDSQSPTKVHWQAPQSSDKCKQCQVRYDIVEKRQWCYSLLKSILFTQPILEDVGTFTAKSHPYPVCFQCYCEPPAQGIGQYRDYKQRFIELRSHLRRQQDKHVRSAAGRLVQSFLSNNSRLDLITSTFGYEPSWSKVNFISPSIAALRKMCQSCNATFGVLKHKHHCRLCGDIYCKNCLFRSVEAMIVTLSLVYADLFNTTYNQVFRTSSGRMKVDILHPEYERHGSIMLLGCEKCLSLLEKATKLEKRLRFSVSQSISEGTCPTVEATIDAKVVPLSPAFKQILDMYPELIKTRRRINTTLKELEECTRQLKSGQDIQPGITKTVTIHQCNLDELFRSLGISLQKLKVLASRPMRKIEMRVTRGVTSNMISAKTEHIGTYRRCCDIVSEILPEPVRNAIRAALDFEAIKNTMILLKQLGIECVAFEALEPVAIQFVSVLEEVKTILQQLHEVSFVEGGTTFESVLETIDLVLKDLGKEAPIIVQYICRDDWPDCVLAAWNTTFQCVEDNLERYATYKASDTLRLNLLTLRNNGRRMLQQVAKEQSELDDWVVLK